MTGGGDINSLGLLPDKLKTEIALHVNLETLKKVSSISNILYILLHLLIPVGRHIKVKTTITDFISCQYSIETFFKAYT